jgi:hypothetical protein
METSGGDGEVGVCSGHGVGEEGGVRAGRVCMVSELVQRCHQHVQCSRVLVAAYVSAWRERGGGEDSNVLDCHWPCPHPHRHHLSRLAAA